MPEQSSQQPPASYDPHGRVEDIDTHETKIAEVGRHPVGLYLLYSQTLIAVAFATGLIALLLPSVGETLGISRSTSAAIIAVLILFSIVFCLVFLALADSGSGCVIRSTAIMTGLSTLA